ncbi:hypothetical protein JCM30237_16230 [Halolamina litorea]|uniref:PGF-CTERM protein n=1 Tax=Halolamina litorea TaxID=1515593 RepID=A0ABD6BU57_9EURY
MVCEGTAKYEWRGNSYSQEFSSLDVTVSGSAAEATITNNEAFAVDVYVKAGSEQSGAGVSGPTTVEPGESVQVTGTDDKDISAIGIVCEGAGTPDFPPFSLPNAAGPPGGGTNGGPGPVGFVMVPAAAALGAAVLGRRR